MSTGAKGEDEDELFTTTRLAPGDVLEGQWRVERRLGKGGMGSVFLAHDVKLDRKVAVKIISEELSDHPEWLARFEREIRLTARIEHPNVVPVYGQGRHGVRPFVVMKALEGMPLSRYLKQMPGRLPLVEVRALMRQLCAALACVHEKGLIHRDVKPSNLFVGADGHLTLLDLGIALDVSADPLTRTGEVMGTPQYIAPEQALGRKVDHRVDLFSAGVLLFELLAGERPFVDVRDGRVASLSERAPGVHPALAAVTARAIAREPADRYPHAAALAAAIEAACEEAARPQVAKRTSSRAVPLVAAGLVVLVLAGVGLGLSWPKRDVPQPVAPMAPVVVAVAEPAQPAPEPEPPVAVPEPAAAVKRAPVKARPATKKDERGGRLRVTTLFQGEPTWANLVVDGVPRGATPLMLEVSAGSHKVKVERPGFRSESRTVEVPPGDQAVLKVDLRH